jgi:hypothetical protein
MSEEFCDGVKILLKRMESNPEEFKGQDNKWSSLIPKGSGGYIDWDHALTVEEIKALAEGVRKIHRVVYTEKVMSTLLYSTEEENVMNAVESGGRVSINRYKAGAIHPLPINPYQNTIQAGSWQAVATQPEKLSLTEILKNKLKYSL